MDSPAGTDGTPADAGAGAMPEGTSGAGDPPLTITTSRQFAGWLAGTGASLAFTTYQSGKLFLVGTRPGTGAEGPRLAVFERTIERPMGLACDGRRLVVAGQTQITTFVDALDGRPSQDGHDALFVPQLAHYTGDLDAHDVALGADGIVFANTLFSCLAAVSDTHSFRPLWRPGFVTRLAPEDRCHLNGFTLDEAGRPAYATAVAETDMADAWREHREGGGVVLDVAAGRTVCAGLSMPHSPRLHGGRLYVLNSGAGEFGVVDRAAGGFRPLAFCPGYLRGLAFLGRHAIVGLSQPRGNRTFAGLPLQARLAAAKAEPRCALYVIDVETGDVAHWLRLEGVVSELYDVAALPGVRRPAMVGFKSDEIRRMITIAEADPADDAADRHEVRPRGPLGGSLMVTPRVPARSASSSASSRTSSSASIASGGGMVAAGCRAEAPATRSPRAARSAASKSAMHRGIMRAAARLAVAGSFVPRLTF